ncbi:MAG: hypothetical protein AAGI07_02015 [Bacteroidota bacterium]
MKNIASVLQRKSIRAFSLVSDGKGKMLRTRKPVEEIVFKGSNSIVKTLH